MINIICCVCKKKYGAIQEEKDRVVESHGYCKKCHKTVMKKIKAMKLKR